MKKLIYFLLFLIASVLIGLYVIRHPGYVFIVYQPWTIETPLWFAILCLLVFLGLFYIIFNSVDRLQFSWFRFKNWLRFKRAHRSYSKTQMGLCALVEGQWKKAEYALTSSIRQLNEPLINYLGAAKAAHEQKAFERRDQYLRAAHQAAPDADLAIGLVQAELTFAQDQLEQSLAVLNRLYQASPRHPQVLRLLERIYVRMSDWGHLKDLLPQLKKAKILTQEQFELFEKNIYVEMFHASHNKREEFINSLFESAPKYMKKNPDVLYAYLKAIERFSTTDQKIVETFIRKTLQYQWHAGLAMLYGQLPLSNVNRQLVIVNAWLNRYGDHPELLFILGKLCVQAQLWGKAKDYFKRCLAAKPEAAVFFEYGSLLDELGEHEEAKQIYRDGLLKLSLSS
ncbi:MAG: hypothetical protein A3F12_05060 [Gammaproteobacteria bacterium RIFCSPHIGHO2_12_FULL_38_14]|nr:MAG: hypothetical protein A3F12_05060 [Gammaproteobacteria bacterium RIFCSPHIGHO2_12_FULL_38_14]